MKPAGRPELDPSAADKAAVLEVVDDVGNSAAAEACTPSAASDSSSIRRPGVIFMPKRTRRLQALALNLNGLKAAD